MPLIEMTNEGISEENEFAMVLLLAATFEVDPESVGVKGLCGGELVADVLIVLETPEAAPAPEVDGDDFRSSIDVLDAISAAEPLLVIFGGEVNCNPIFVVDKSVFEFEACWLD